MALFVQYVPLKRHEDDIHRLEMDICDLRLELITAQAEIHKLQSAIDIPERVDKYCENAYYFRGPVEINSTPDGVTVILLKEKEE